MTYLRVRQLHWPLFIKQIPLLFPVFADHVKSDILNLKIGTYFAFLPHWMISLRLKPKLCSGLTASSLFPTTINSISSNMVLVKKNYFRIGLKEMKFCLWYPINLIFLEVCSGEYFAVKLVLKDQLFGKEITSFKLSNVINPLFNFIKWLIIYTSFINLLTSTKNSKTPHFHPKNTTQFNSLPNHYLPSKESTKQHSPSLSPPYQYNYT